MNQAKPKIGDIVLIKDAHDYGRSKLPRRQMRVQVADPPWEPLNKNVFYAIPFNEPFYNTLDYGYWYRIIDIASSPLKNFRKKRAKRIGRKVKQW